MDLYFHNLPFICRVRPWRAPAANMASAAPVNATAVFRSRSESHLFRHSNPRIKHATCQSAVFKTNLNDDRENAARSSASNAQVLRGVASRAGQVFSSSAAIKDVIVEFQPSTPPAGKKFARRSRWLRQYFATSFVDLCNQFWPAASRIIFQRRQTIFRWPLRQFGAMMAKMTNGRHCGILAPRPGADRRPSKPKTKCVSHVFKLLVPQLNRAHSCNLNLCGAGR